MATKILQQQNAIPQTQEKQSISEKLRDRLYGAGQMLGAIFGPYASIESLSSEYRAQLSAREKAESDIDFFGLR